MRMDSRYIALLGKLVTRYGIMADIKDFEDNERELLRMALTEYNFYHAHERVEAGTSEDVIVEPSTIKAGNGTLKLKQTTR